MASDRRNVEGHFVESLHRLENGQRAELRRCLTAKKPSDHLPAYRYVEPFLPPNQSAEHREHFYLVAGLFGLIERKPEKGELGYGLGRATPMRFARAVRRYEMNIKEPGDNGVSSVERRFLTLLDSDVDQLPHRLRQMVQLIKRGSRAVEADIDWKNLLIDLGRWTPPNDSARRQWAKQFYAVDHN